MAGVLCSHCGVMERTGNSYSLMDNTKSEKMPTTCHRRMSQNTTVSLVSGGGLGLGGAVLGWKSGERRVSRAEAKAWDGAERGPCLSKNSAQACRNLRITCLRHSQPMP